MTPAGTPILILASLLYVMKAPFRIAEAPSVSVISEAIWPEVALSIVVMVISLSMRSLVSS